MQLRDEGPAPLSQGLVTLPSNLSDGDRNRVLISYNQAVYLNIIHHFRWQPIMPAIPDCGAPGV